MTKSTQHKIVQFISSVGNKKYHEANKYLCDIVNDNIKDKIANAVKTTKLF